MKNQLYLVLFFLTSSSFAQSEYNYESVWMQRYNNAIVYNVPGVKNKEVDIVTKKIKGNKEWHYKKQYDENGKLIKYMKLSKGRTMVLNENTYDRDGRMINTKNFKESGKLKRELKIERNTEGKELKSERYEEGKLKHTKVWNYKPEGCVEMSTLTQGNGKLKYKWLYEYYSECDKKRSLLLKANGKVKKEWTYDCKKEGEQVVKKNDVTQICKWEEHDGKHLVKVYQSIDDKGKTYKVVTTYRASDTAVVKSERYNDNGELTYVSTYDFSYEKPLTYSSFKKGKINYETIYTYENDRMVSYFSKRNSKVKYKSIYTYNQEDLLTEIKNYDKGGERVSKVTSIHYN